MCVCVCVCVCVCMQFVMRQCYDVLAADFELHEFVDNSLIDQILKWKIKLFLGLSPCR